MSGSAIGAPPSGPYLAGLRLRIGNALVDAASSGEVAARIEASNAASRIDGLQDEFNPAIIDPHKAAALLAALTPEMIAKLGGKALDLDGPALRIAASSPTTTASFSHGVTLAVGSDHGDSVSARAELAVDCAQARLRAAAARDRTAEAARLEEAAAGNAASAARRLRYAVALAWWDNASAAAACAPSDGHAAADRDAAEAAARAAMILGGNMGGGME